MSSASAAIRTQRGEPPVGALVDSARAGSLAETKRATGPCRYELVTTRAGFDGLAAEWNDLFARAGRGTQAFQTFNWNWHWCNNYLHDGRDGDRSLAVVTGRRGGRLVMVWPLVRTRVAGLVQLAWMGEPVSQYGDVLVEDTPDAVALLRAAWAYVIDLVSPDLVWLPKVRDDAAVAPLITELGALPTQRLQAPYLDLSSAPDFETYVRRYSSRSRKKRRASFNRLAKLGRVNFARHEGGSPARQLAAGAIEMKRVQLKDRALISPAFADQRITRFFGDAADGLGHPSGCTTVALESNGERAAIDVLVGCKDRVATHILAYNSKFERESVGVHLLEHAIARSFAEGYRTFDLLAPADDYKMHWADGVVGVTDWAIPVSVKGKAFTRLYLMLGRPLLKSIVNALPPALRRLVASRYFG
jgi:CelD/BcsL family acetyltransferase involved in cellulose biosynthesis